MGIVGSLVVTTALYIATAGVLVLMVPYTQVRPVSRPPAAPTPAPCWKRSVVGSPCRIALRLAGDPGSGRCMKSAPLGPRRLAGVRTVFGLQVHAVAVLSACAGFRPSKHVSPEPITIASRRVLELLCCRGRLEGFSAA